MSAALLAPQDADLERLKALVLDSVTAPESKRAYRKALADFLTWYHQEPRAGFTKATVQAYRTHLEDRGLSPTTLALVLGVQVSW